MRKKQPVPIEEAAARPSKWLNKDSALSDLDDPWREVVSEIAAADDLDPLAAGIEIRAALYLQKLAGELSKRDSEVGESPQIASAYDTFLARFRRKRGWAGLREFAAERLQACNTLSQSWPKLQKLAEIERECKSKRSPQSAKSKMRSAAAKQSTARSTDNSPLDPRPIAHITSLLDGLDRCLETLETGSSGQETHGTTRPDAAACFGLGLAFGQMIGFAAAEMRYHRELDRAEWARKHYQKTGAASKQSWQIKHPREAKLLISDVLEIVLFTAVRLMLGSLSLIAQ